jgi:hemoglobin
MIREAGSPGIDEAALSHLVDRFYDRVRADEQLGPLFNATIHDWPEHLAKLTRFWSSVMLGTGRYKGNPVVAHRAHAGAIDVQMFDRWLALWRATASEVLGRAEATAIALKAERIAESLKLALFFKIPASDPTTSPTSSANA